MVSDEHFEMCLPILQDATLEDEDKTDRLEELFRKETSLTGTSLDNAILDALWRFRDGGGTSTSPPPIRQTILRRPSPASWRGSPTPMSGSPRLAVSPLAPPGFVPSTFGRTISSTVSPFSSPRASPRLALATPVIPHSPNLNAYEFATDPTPATEILGEYQTENVEWLVSDDAASVTSSLGTPSALNAAAPEFSSMSAQSADMSPYDMLRSILGQTKSDDEIEAALAQNGYDLSATIVSFMESQVGDNQSGGVSLEEPKNVLIGKSVDRPSTPLGQQKSGVICKFYMSTGQCLRADCRFSHDLSNHLCKYWVMGNCLAGETCIFSHDPTKLMSKLALDGASTPPSRQGGLQLGDLNSFPSLRPGTPDHLGGFAGSNSFPAVGITPPPGLKHFQGTSSPRARSRPGSRHQSKETDISAPALDDNDAFPSLGSASAKQGKKHHGKRGGHGHAHKENNAPNSLADIVKMSPSPTAVRPELKRGLGRNGNSTAVRNGENSAAAQAIPSPKHIPWLETGERANKAYLKARQEAIKHGGLRNKFLQSAAQAWNRNDARAAKALSLRGQSENDLMRKAHREAAKELYEERNKGNSNGMELYVDLHGLHPEEAVEYLEKVLMENGRESQPIYAITGSGHHSKNGKDKVGRAIRNFLNEWRYAYREFSVPGDRNNMGGILGIDARSWDKSLAKEGDSDDKEELDILSQGVEIGDGKVRLLLQIFSPKMPVGYNSTAQAHALSPDRVSSPSPSHPPWTATSSSRRLSNPLMNHRRASSSYASSGKASFVRRIWGSVNLLGEQVLKVYLRLSPFQRILALVGVVAAGVLGILAIVYSHVFFKWLEPKAEQWYALPGGWILAFLLVFVTSFPPIVGYSTASTIAGFVYGFPWGWPIVASGCTAGALCAFLASRTILSGYVDRMVGRDHRFVALGQVLRQEGIWYLTAIRFCPLPFSLSNGFLATIPSITPLAFTISTALSSPKLLVHVFIGSRLALLAKNGDKMSAGSKAINYLSMILGGVVGLIVGLVIYRRTMARAEELARQDGLDPTGLSAEEGEAGYADSENSMLMDPEDAAVLMSDDDISLWGRDGTEGRYHDDDGDEEEATNRNKRGGQGA
ncbi:nuclear WD PRL1 [Fusarium beomiforme]|uniref:Golgi apparatus membrane protein TVP38 n=1 Tax=Fusarium beomiforme TaxID=44412 RepID=A0A9P5DXW9_9HYPO|nr:nuclear WD PRL1 [Fusarium beomiforme]